MRTDLLVLLLVVLFALITWYITSQGGISYGSSSDSSLSAHPMLDQVRMNFAKIDPKFGNIPLREGKSAYTENKRIITLCLVDPDSKVHYDVNTIMYVALHELAHVISKKHGHGDEFKRNFNMLLRKGAQLGIYDPRKPIPTSYCGVKN